MKYVSLSLLVLIALPAAVSSATTLYKCHDYLGNVIFTDEPCRGGTEIQVEPANVYDPGKLPELKFEKKFAYRELRFVIPLNNEKLPFTPAMRAILAVQPALLEEHQLWLYLDGRRVPGDWRTTTIPLENLTPGKHNLQAAIVDKTGKGQAWSRRIYFELEEPAKPSGKPAKP